MNNAPSGHQPRKRFGQNFLKDTHSLHKMIAAIAARPDDLVLEIGPGQGALTELLLDGLNQLDVLEIDRDLVDLLQHKFAEQDKLHIHQGDALKQTVDELFPGTQKIRIVGNLPYNISTPLLFHYFAQIQRVADMHFLLQQEVVQRLTAKVNTRYYNRLSVMAQLYCDNEMLFTIAPTAFYPAPKVTSAFVRLCPRADYLPMIKQIDVFANVVKQAFNYRRKTIANALKNTISAQQLAAVEVDPKQRPQQIDIASYIRISNAITIE